MLNCLVIWSASKQFAYLSSFVHQSIAADVNRKVTIFCQIFVWTVDSLPFLSDYSRASTWYRAISTNYPVVIALPIMEDTRLHKYYRTPGYGLNSLIYRFLITDYNLRRYLNLNAYCGMVTLVTFIFAAIIAVCSIASLNTITSNGALFRELFKKAEKVSCGSLGNHSQIEVWSRLERYWTIL